MRTRILILMLAPGLAFAGGDEAPIDCHKSDAACLDVRQKAIEAAQTSSEAGPSLSPATPRQVVVLGPDAVASRSGRTATDALGPLFQVTACDGEDCRGFVRIQQEGERPGPAGVSRESPTFIVHRRTGGPEGPWVVAKHKRRRKPRRKP